MRLTIAYSKMKKRNLVLIINATYQRETLLERPIRQPLSGHWQYFKIFFLAELHLLHQKRKIKFLLKVKKS